MTLIASRGLIRASKNPTCELLTAMAVEGVDEKDLRESILGAYEGEYGERASARRRGAQFEQRNHQNDAAVLKEKLGPLIGRDPASMTVRNFGEEYPGPPARLHAVRLHRVRKILEDLKNGKDVPDLIIQPTLAIDVLGGPRGSMYLSPDFMVLDRRIGSYRIGEEKSFIVRRRNVEPKDLDNTRRQSAAGILALADEMCRIGLAPQSNQLALFIFATPYGMNATDPYEEQLRAEIAEVERARTNMRAAAAKMVQLRQQMNTINLADLVDEFNVNYRQSCVSTCLMAPYCEARSQNNAAIFGDAAARAVGNIPLGELPRLLDTASDTLSEPERLLRRELEACADALGITHDALRGMIA